MNKMRRTIAMSLGILFAFTTIVTAAIFVSAADNEMDIDTYLYADKTTYYPGEEVYYDFSTGDVEWADNRIEGAGMNNVQVPMTWDTTIFEFVTVEPGADMRSPSHLKFTGQDGGAGDLQALAEGRLMVQYYDNNSDESSDVQFFENEHLFTVVLKVREDATATQGTLTYDQYVNGIHRMNFGMYNDVYSGNPRVKTYWTNKSGNPTVFIATSGNTLTEKYIADDGTELQESKTETVSYEQVYSSTAPESFTHEGVEFLYSHATVNGQEILNEDGTYASSVEVPITKYIDYTVVYYYSVGGQQEDAFTVTEQFKDEAGNDIQPPETTKISDGKTYSRAYPVIEGYDFAGATVNGTAASLVDGERVVIEEVKENYTVVYLYKDNNGGNGGDKDTYTVTERYQDAAGKEIKTSVNTPVKAGEGYAKQAPEIDGYTLTAVFVDGVQMTGQTATIVSVTEDHDVVFVYVSKNGNGGNGGNGSGSSSDDGNNANGSSNGSKYLNTSSSNPVTGAMGVTMIIAILAIAVAGTIVFKAKRNR